ncbi:hypothetical protein GPX89_19790 [Nocardia sp. ET3-3]|uniref:Uncharacterized protein n=1 Tax=Nocardia terrae TaxID=2675851 RepID=A0A7K1UYZ3_9NOCA|nr:hypothetical protein [Nocardia terrae]MVU79477.1 hypothetical protein [Nocardia terrae]
MNRNDIRAAGFGIAGGMVVAIGTIAYFALDLEVKIPNAIHRWQLSPADRTEYDAIRQAQTDKYADADRKREQAQLEVRAKFRPDLLSISPKVPVLSELPLEALISEIRYAKTRKRRAIETARGTFTCGDSTDMWTQQIAALRSEFQRRDTEPLSFLDRARHNAARHDVNSHDDEWPPFRAFNPATEQTAATFHEEQAVVASDPLTTYPPYPDFSGPTAPTSTEEP